MDLVWQTYKENEDKSVIKSALKSETTVIKKTSENWIGLTTPQKYKVAPRALGVYVAKEGNRMARMESAKIEFKLPSHWQNYDEIVINKNDKNDSEFLSKIDSLFESNEKDLAVDYVYEYFGELILKKHFKRCNKIIESINEKNYTTWILLPFLTLTKPYTEQISNRADLFVNAVLKFSETLSIPQLQATIKRLK